MNMVEETIYMERQRLAWGVLIASFSVFVLICISTPIVLNAVLQNSTRPLETLAQANEGTVGIDNEAGNRAALIVGDPRRAIASGDHVLTGNNATALVTVRAAESAEPLASFQIYRNSDFHLLAAETPRFDLSNRSRQLVVRLDNGRVRFILAEATERPSTILLQTPQGEVVVNEPGEYAIIVNPEDTQVTVQAGMARVSARGRTIALSGGARARISNGEAPEGPLDAERNLIANGDFNLGRGQWILHPWIVDLAAQPEGQVLPVDMGGDSRLNIVRHGVGHAEVLLRQSINQDVGELASLRLLLTFHIVSQSLGLCGVKGSECPLVVRINYVDEEGVSRTWQQGFYAAGNVDPELSPDTCITCPFVQSPHIRVPLAQDYFFEIADFREELARHGRVPARFIESISLVFSGHDFEVEVSDIALLAEE